MTPEHTLTIAHRGATSLAPENTLAAAVKAHELGADMWEFDVRLTKDERPVLMHDRTLTRTTDAEEVFPQRENYRVSDFKLEEIKQLDAGSWFLREDPYGEISKGSVTATEANRFRGQPVPTLEEALDLTAKLEWWANVEVKTPVEGNSFSQEAIETTVQAITDCLRRSTDTSRVLVSSFDDLFLQNFSQISPDIDLAFLAAEPPADPLELLARTGAKAFSVNESFFDTEEGRDCLRKVACAKEDYRIYVWTVNDEKGLNKLRVDPLVNGVVTDYPQRLAAGKG